MRKCHVVLVDQKFIVLHVISQQCHQNSQVETFK
jgi:hypothetical protein